MLKENNQTERLDILHLTLSQIPPGKITTYGILAKYLGLNYTARSVGRALGKLPSDSMLPWHRVIPASGSLNIPEYSISGKIQRERLQSEGIVICNNKVNVRQYNWQLIENKR
ncbi:UNVERIFIED_CONTAM: hypothetical protein GTU68_001250 [Idotea baltica]|nr:hypothetical protein [Idotea baltica]